AEKDFSCRASQQCLWKIRSGRIVAAARGGDSTPVATLAVKASVAIAAGLKNYRSVRTGPRQIILIGSILHGGFLGIFSGFAEIIGVAQRLWHALQRQLQYLINPFHRLDRQIGLDVVGNLLQIRLVFVRDDDGFNTAAMCSEQRSEEHTSELQSRENLVCRLL